MADSEKMVDIFKYSVNMNTNLLKQRNIDILVTTAITTLRTRTWYCRKLFRQESRINCGVHPQRIVFDSVLNSNYICAMQISFLFGLKLTLPFLLDKESIDKEMQRLGIEALMFWELPEVEKALSALCNKWPTSKKHPICQLPLRISPLVYF